MRQDWAQTVTYPKHIKYIKMYWALFAECGLDFIKRGKVSKEKND